MFVVAVGDSAAVADDEVKGGIFERREVAHIGFDERRGLDAGLAEMVAGLLEAFAARCRRA